MSMRVLGAVAMLTSGTLFGFQIGRAAGMSTARVDLEACAVRVNEASDDFRALTEDFKRLTANNVAMRKRVDTVLAEHRAIMARARAVGLVR